jgi:hypothetical protein
MPWPTEPSLRLQRDRVIHHPYAQVRRAAAPGAALSGQGRPPMRYFGLPLRQGHAALRNSCVMPIFSMEDVREMKIKMLKEAFVVIARYIEKKKPKSLAEAEHMLAVISVIAEEAIIESEKEPALI